MSRCLTVIYRTVAVVAHHSTFSSGRRFDCRHQRHISYREVWSRRASIPLPIPIPAATYFVCLFPLFLLAFRLVSTPSSAGRAARPVRQVFPGDWCRLRTRPDPEHNGSRRLLWGKKKRSTVRRCLLDAGCFVPHSCLCWFASFNGTPARALFSEERLIDGYNYSSH